MRARAIRRLVGCFMLIFVVCAIVFSQEYSINEIVFLPPTFYVGDVVEVRLRIDAGDVVLPTVPEQLPEAPLLSVHEIRVIPIIEEYDIRIRFSSFGVGKSHIPAFNVGELTVNPIPIETASIRDSEESEPYGVFDPVYLPGTKLFIGLIAGIVLSGPLLLILLIGWIRTVAKKLAITVKRPYRRLHRELVTLRGSITILSSRDFYQRLFESFRRYLTQRTGVNYQSMTTREMTARMRDDFGDIESLHQFGPMIDAIDHVKFGGGDVDHSAKIEELSIVQSSAAQIEERFRKGGAE